MTLAQLTSVIDQAAELGVTDVYFEGGEPTLAYPIVLAAAKRARERGLDVGIVSNCFWATSVEDAKVWLAPFAELGISRPLALVLRLLRRGRRRGAPAQRRAGGAGARHAR